MFPCIRSSSSPPPLLQIAERPLHEADLAPARERDGISGPYGENVLMDTEWVRVHAPDPDGVPTWERLPVQGNKCP